MMYQRVLFILVLLFFSHFVFSQENQNNNTNKQETDKNTNSTNSQTETPNKQENTTNNDQNNNANNDQSQPPPPIINEGITNKNKKKDDKEYPDQHSIILSYDFASAFDQGYGAYIFYRYQQHQFTAGIFGANLDANRLANIPASKYREYQLFGRFGYSYFIFKNPLLGFYIGAHLEYGQRWVTRLSNDKQFLSRAFFMSIVLGYNVLPFDANKNKFLSNISFRVWLAPRFPINYENYKIDNQSYTLNTYNITYGFHIEYRFKI